MSVGSGSISPASTDFTNGTATESVTLDDATAGQVITAADGSVSGASNTFDVQSGGVDAGNSSVSASPETLQAGDNSTLTIELRDGGDNPVTGLSDSDFEITVTGSGTAGTVTESGSTGNYSATVSNTSAEQVTASVTADGVSVGSATITFTAADADDLTIEDGNNQTGTVLQSLGAPFVVKVTDQFGNPVSGQTVTYSITDEPTGATGQSLSSSTASTNSSGEASTTLTLGDKPGAYRVQAEVSGRLR